MFDTLKQFDRILLLKINALHSIMFDDVMFYISQIWVFAPLFAYCIYLIITKLKVKKSTIIFLFFVLLIVLCDQSSNQVKHAIKRYRPTHNIEIMHQLHTVNTYVGGQYGFFSGHATNAFGVAMFLFLIFNKQHKLFRYGLFACAAIISYSRIYLGVHYPSDIFVGMLAGLFLGFVIFKTANYLFQKKFDEIISI